MENRRSRYDKVCCPEHPDAILIEDYKVGDQICPECGLVVGDRVIDVGSEWRSFSNDMSKADPSRVGGAENPLLNGGDLSTIIGPSPSGSYNDKYTNRRSQNSASNQTLIKTFQEINNMAEKINLAKSIVDRGHVLFKDAYNSRALRGRSNDAIGAACLYIACRQEGVPRTFKEICAVSRVNKREIGRCFKSIIKTLDTSVEIIKTEDFMSRFCANLALDRKIQRAATFIAKKAVDLDMVPGRSPISVAAAAIYMASQASDVKKTAKEVGDIAGVADVTIKQSYKLMYPKAKDLFPQDFVFFTPVNQLPPS